jgi:7,8-didemethyl-8-hydroxy-5-deazariboflavin synthase CofG subunit
MPARVSPAGGGTPLLPANPIPYLSRGDAYDLIRAPEAELPALMQAAAVVRDRFKGRTATYSRKIFLPLTNLCRDSCGYCTFVKQPGDPAAHTMSPDEVLRVARAGERLGCKEALFSLGDKPELKYRGYRDWLEQRGYRSTLHYLAEMCGLILRETGLLPHVNAGIMTAADIAALREVSVSMGLMLESTSLRLLRPGGAHFRCPDKLPRLRLATLEEAGRQQFACTTGILIGIGETPEERVDALFAIKSLHEQYGQIQEVIVQNFRAKPETAMQDQADAGLDDMRRTIAVARLILQDINIQAPPNLMPNEYGQYLAAGINDWGGISPLTQDFINPERPWPQIDELRGVCAEAGFELRERLALYPSYITGRREFLPVALEERVAVLADEHGLVRREAEAW